MCLEIQVQRSETLSRRLKTLVFRFILSVSHRKLNSRYPENQVRETIFRFYGGYFQMNRYKNSPCRSRPYKSACFCNGGNRLLRTIVVHYYGDDFCRLVSGGCIKKGFSTTPVVRPLLFYYCSLRAVVRTKVLLAGTVPARCNCYVSGSFQMNQGCCRCSQVPTLCSLEIKQDTKVTKDQPCR